MKQDLTQIVAARLAKIIDAQKAVIEESSGPDCTLFTVRPARPQAASLTVVVPADGKVITVIAGKGTVFEIPEEGGSYTGLAALEELEAICMAVMTNGLEESVVLDGDELLSGTGETRLPGASKLTRVRWRRLTFRPFSKKDRINVRYEPW